MDNKIIEIDLDEQLENANWHWAKSYAKIAPHHYIRMMEEPLLYGLLHMCISDQGVDENYTNRRGNTYLCRYFYYKEYKYWCMNPVINRAITKGENYG